MKPLPRQAQLYYMYMVRAILIYSWYNTLLWRAPWHPPSIVSVGENIAMAEIKA